MGAKINYAPGEQYGRLTVIQENGRSPHGQVMLDCVCVCGETVNVRGYSLRQGRTQSCGCLLREAAVLVNTTHGHTRGRAKGRQWSPTYLSWSAMIARCTNPNTLHWDSYGGRGITVCDRWLQFENFLLDMGERSKGLSIDRIDVDGNYEPGNCRWATALEQARNKRSHKERKKEARERMQEELWGDGMSETRSILEEYVAAADWYRRCLEDVNDRRVVRGLGEAKAAYDSALTRARAVLENP